MKVIYRTRFLLKNQFVSVWNHRGFLYIQFLECFSLSLFHDIQWQLRSYLTNHSCSFSICLGQGLNQPETGISGLLKERVFEFQDTMCDLIISCNFITSRVWKKTLNVTIINPQKKIMSDLSSSRESQCNTMLQDNVAIKHALHRLCSATSNTIVQVYDLIKTKLNAIVSTVGA